MNIVPSNLLNVMCTHLVCVSVWVYACVFVCGVCVRVCVVCVCMCVCVRVKMPPKKIITQFNINITEVTEIHHP